MSDCIHLGKPVGKKKCGQEARRCKLLDCHVVEGVGSQTVPGCAECKDKLSAEDSKFDVSHDPLEVIDRRRERTEVLRNLLAGSSVFLACAGPSANLLPLKELNRRGVWTMAVNNMAAHAGFRPQAFVCSDPPVKFSHSIWLDPAVMKFVPTPKMTGSRAKLKRKTGPGKFEPLDRAVKDCPNVWGFRRESWLRPDDSFFSSKGACWGNLKTGSRETGEPRTVNTMFLAMRLLRHLGAGRVFMIGVDFRMSGNYGYAFEQAVGHKDAGGYDNDQYTVANDWLCRMQQAGVFSRHGIEFYNCFRESSLRAFPFVPFERALRECRGLVEDKPDLSEWYESKK